MKNNMLGFDQNRILPYSQTKYAKRSARIQEGLKQYAEEKDTKKLLDEQSKIVETEMYRESAAKNLINSKSSNTRRRLLEENRIIEKVTKQALSLYLTEMVINGLVFDDYYIEEKRDTLRTNINKVFTECFDKGVFTPSDFENSSNLFLAEAYNNIKDNIKDLLNKRDTVDIFSEDSILEMLSEARKADETSKEISDSVKEKVTDTLTNEKKIAKKKEEEEQAAADSLDDDPDDSLDADDELDDASSEEDEDSEEDESDDDMDDEDDSIEDDMEEDADDEEESDTELDSDDDDLDDASSEDDTEGMEEDSTSADSATTSDGNNLVITVKTNGSSVSVTANKNESTSYLNIFGRNRYKERNKPSIFRNLLENNIYKSASMLSESSNKYDRTINMDNVLAESIIEYTILETIHTSKLVNISNREIESLRKTMNFNRTSK